jgi:PKD repeat protein
MTTLRIHAAAAILSLVLCASAGAQVLVNEVFTGAPDWLEVLNAGTAAVDVSGWTVYFADDPSVVTVFSFPIPTILAAGELVVISDSASAPAVPPGVRVFVTGGNVNWLANSGGTCALLDAAGSIVDHLIFSGATNLPAPIPSAPWAGTGTVGQGPNPLDDFFRTSMIDTNSDADWSTQASGTAGALNAGQTAVPPAVPQAAIGVQATTVTAGEPLQFIDTSTGLPTSWVWDFQDDGVTDSSARHPVFTYALPGVYSVRHTATNALGTSSVTQTGLVVVTAPVRAALPYSETFAGAGLGAEWTIARENGLGRVRLATDGGAASPGSGGTALALDVGYTGTIGAACTNTARLRVNVAGLQSVVLKYWVRETGDEDDSQDGVFLSNGTTAVGLASQSGTISAWTEVTVDVAAAAANAGFNVAGDLFVVFSQRDDFSIPTDGCLYDDVRLMALMPDTGQANSSLASLDVSQGQNLNGQTALPGLHGPFFASGSILEVRVEGLANQPYVLLLGPLNRGNAVFPIGSLDIGSMGASMSFADVTVILDGVQGGGFFDLLARLDAGGRSELVFNLSTAPLGVIGTLQAAVFNTTPGVAALTAAFEFTVAP